MKSNWSNFNDEEIISQYLHSQKDSVFEELYLRYNEKIYNYMRRYLYYSPEDIVRDILSEVFIKVYLNISKLQQVKTFKGWIFQIAHNECINHIKAQPRVVQEPDLIISQTIDKRIDIENDYIEEEIRKFLLAQIKKFDPAIREIIILKFFHNLTYEEIAEITGKSLRTVKYRMKDALEQLESKFVKAGFFNEKL